jgi:hypothetical protein
LSSFQVLRSRTHFWRYRGSEIQFLCFALSDSFSTVQRVSSLVFIFCAPVLIFGVIEGALSRIQVLRYRTLLGRYRGRRVQFSCFTLSDSFSVVPRERDLIFMFCALRLIFDDTLGVGSRFHILRSRNLFRRYRKWPVHVSLFTLPDTFSTVPSAACPVFMFCAPERVFDGTEGLGS